MKRYFKQIMSIGILVAMLITLIPCGAMAGTYTIGTLTWTMGSIQMPIRVDTVADATSIQVALTRTNANGYGKDGAYYWFNGGQQKYLDIQKTPDNPSRLDLGNMSTTALQPDKAYEFKVKIKKICKYNGAWGSVDTGTAEKIITMYTEPTIPYGFTFPNIGQGAVNIKWNNNGNPSDTNYTLQRRLDGTTTYVNIISKVNMSEHTDSGLSPDTKYWYRVRVNAKNGYEYFSNEFAVTTSADPAVAAAKAAQSAAESASAFAETARIHSIQAAERTWDIAEAKSAATLAKEARDKANQALIAINNVNANTQPVILRASGLNMATCTLGTTYDVTVVTIGATEFRVRAGVAEWSDWTTVSGYATATGL